MVDMNQLKQQAAISAISHIEYDIVLGVGTGSTVKFFIEQLPSVKDRIKAIVSSSKQSTKLLKQYNLPVVDLNSIGEVNLYVDGADEINESLEMIKGGGAALTCEKIVAAVSKRFICIVDESKLVKKLGKFPLPVEVIPMARSYVAREMVKLGGAPTWREGVITDSGNYILDVHNLDILEPIALEQRINNIVGVVTNGIFAKRSADMALIAKADGSVATMR